MPLRAGINALYLIPGGVGGTEIYLRKLLAALAAIDGQNQYVVFTNRETGEDLVPLASNFEHAPQPVRAANRPARIFWEQTGLAAAAKRHGLDVLFNPGFTSPIIRACPAVTVFHDLQHKRHPEYFRWFELPFWRSLLYASAHRSRHLIAVSEATRDDLIAVYGLPAEKITVVHHGVDRRFFELRRDRLEPYLLCVSTLHPHKNLDRLVRAFARLREQRPEFRLVIAGLRGFHAEALDALIASLGLQEAVHLTGWIGPEELYELYEKAFACVAPSTFEGFGMPALEALAAGVPLACSSIPPHREVVGDAALLFDPLDEGALIEALARITLDTGLRGRLAAAGRQRAAGFTWEKCARGTLAVLESAACKD